MALLAVSVLVWWGLRVGMAPHPLVMGERSHLQKAEREGRNFSHGKCRGTDYPKLRVLPMKLEDVAMIVPYGLMVGGHVTPIDHQYFSPTVFHSPRDTYEVRAMADSRIIAIQHRSQALGDPTAPKPDEYRLVFMVSCVEFYYYDLVTSLSPDIKAVYDRGRRPNDENADVDIPVKAGQVIGRIGGRTLDFAVWDMAVTLPGLLVPEHYEREPWKIHTADPLRYYTDEVKAQALTKYLRTTEPLSGHIDYDRDGFLVGTWFLEGTDFQARRRHATGVEYRAEISVVPDHLDPTATITSFGDWQGKPKQFMVHRSDQNPAAVSQVSGVVKYTLQGFRYQQPDGQQWNGMRFAKHLTVVPAEEGSAGCVLFQLVATRRLKMQIFPAQACSQIAGFTISARTYTR